METVLLKAEKRDLGLKARDVRLSNKIPAIFYGFKQENIPLSLNYIEFRNVFKKAGRNTVIKLQLNDGKEFNALVHDIARDPVQDTFSHIDLVQVRMDREIHTKIPIVFIGEAPAVKNFGGILTVQKEDVEIKCLPDKLPHSFELNLSSLEQIGSGLHISDIKVPEGVTILHDPSLIVVTVTALKEEVEEVAPPVTEITGQGPEVPVAEGEGGAEGGAVKAEAAAPVKEEKKEEKKK